MKILKQIGVAAAMATLVATVGSQASAVVVRVDNGNVWTVGKGDVQSLFGWNAQTTDANFAGVSFLYEKLTTTDVICDYTVKWTETYEEVIGGEKNFKVVERTRTVRETRSYTDTATMQMLRTLQYEIKTNKQTNVVGATIWPGGSSTTVAKTSCDEPIALADGESLSGPANSTVIGETVTETIFATSPQITTSTKTKKGTVYTVQASSTATLWSDSSKWSTETPATIG